MSITTQDSIAIEHAGEKLAAALNKGDISLASDLLAENVAVLPPARNAVKGAGVTELLRNMALQSEGFKFMASDMDPFGPAAVREIGTMSMRVKREASERIAYKYLIFWEKVGTEWKLATLVWNRAPVPRGQGRPGRNRQQAEASTGEM